MFPISAHASILLSVPRPFFGGASFLYSLLTGQQNTWLVYHCPTATSPTGGFSPKALFLFASPYGGSNSLSRMVPYHQYSTNHQHIFCSLFQSISTNASC